VHIRVCVRMIVQKLPRGLSGCESLGISVLAQKKCTKEFKKKKNHKSKDHTRLANKPSACACVRRISLMIKNRS
jgi:hypothetical protein